MTPGRDGIVGVSIVVSVEEFLEPLDELKVVLESTLHQTIDRNDLVNVHLLERSLKSNHRQKNNG